MNEKPVSPQFHWKWLVAVSPIVLAIAWLSYRWISPAYNPPSQPSPNGYTKLVALGNQLARRTGFYVELPDYELERVVGTNKPILHSARSVLRGKSAVALDWQADNEWFDNHLKQINSLRSLSRAFAAEGHFAISQGDARSAIDCGLDNLRLGHAVAKGGLGSDWLTGVAVRTVGLMTIRDACDIATIDDCSYAQSRLTAHSDPMEPPAEITRREWHFFRRINGVWSTFLTEMTFANNRADFERRMVDSQAILRIRSQLLRLHLAIRSFELDQNRLPRSLAELPALPEDLLGSDEFVYQVTNDRYQLYSVGLNGVDDGGIEDDLNPAQGDVRLRSYKTVSRTPKSAE